MSPPEFIEMSMKDSSKRACLRDTLRKKFEKIGDGPAHIPKTLTQEQDTRQCGIRTPF